MAETCYTLLQLNKSVEKLALIIFDVDGTLIDRETGPGMLRQAMTDVGVLPRHALMVGDRDEDAAAAKAAGCNFAWTDEFFVEEQYNDD